ncbi:hypothetical protein F9B16_48285 [Actinomadura montaniterrae]|uniref:Uncharacterized protein n=1 Tax=Actinomadura montaniterrae TaxID=1803903 RepID=A0A6L3VG71_9ACTN|nr:hypothetical protein F9B16_48285 [Actinomadura montaniterrae]
MDSGSPGGGLAGAHAGVGGGTIMVFSSSPGRPSTAAAGPPCTGAGSGPTEYTSIGASQFEHLPSVPGV